MFEHYGAFLAIPSIKFVSCQIDVTINTFAYTLYNVRDTIALNPLVGLGFFLVIKTDSEMDWVAYQEINYSLFNALSVM